MRMTAKAFTVAVAGASGYAGSEAARIIAGHPGLRLGALAAHSNAGQPVTALMPQLAGVPGLASEFTDLDPERLAAHDAVVLGLPHGASAELAEQLAATNPDLVIVDAGADFRLASAADWTRWYGSEHAGTWAYGLPELPLAQGGHQRERLAGQHHIAGPGCNASAVALGLAPVLAAGLVDPVALSAALPVGTSGAGRKPKPDMLFSEISGGARPYSIGGRHRHVPEILQSLRTAGAPETTSLSLTAILVPMSRGILAVCTGRSLPGTTTGALLEALNDAYGHEPFISVLEDGQMAATHPVVGSNMVQISAEADPDSGVSTVLVAIDNLVKGTAGAVVQCLNLALGLSETQGLPRIGLAP
ncbi:N-acetyl-gamma-glutamyl-phosphate reductase [Acidipropionibacterium acidipropionici]|uniref:N-acetyl-gamma-glutamyl-phosphate reductase n=1 Tax=Acidipropionibacterium acidipropionici TaxID=1748 RepID=UPI00048B514D|nr:N-acetyl-gamma-glutamyl-phosphate reductase [Acidipropionibacterium acidipropionici]ALN15817.1 N-acetyl-gamma-glutamyl-phosphate reductase [Acidipropionibacterium acidipropionici]APZ08440.1 N-acetyl-gamma-glutamyl-phosphate reductase [Acidipropionibacterium acidipropionici]